MPANVDGDSIKTSASAQASYASSSRRMNQLLNLLIVSSEKILCSTETCMSCGGQQSTQGRETDERGISAGPESVSASFVIRARAILTGAVPPIARHCETDERTL